MSKNSKRVVSVYAVFSKPVVSAMNSYLCISLYELTCVLKFIYIVSEYQLYWIAFCIDPLIGVYLLMPVFASLVPSTHLYSFLLLAVWKAVWVGLGMRVSVGTFWLYMNLFFKGFWLTLIITKSSIELALPKTFSQMASG